MIRCIWHRVICQELVDSTSDNNKKPKCLQRYTSKMQLSMYQFLKPQSDINKFEKSSSVACSCLANSVSKITSFISSQNSQNIAASNTFQASCENVVHKIQKEIHEKYQWVSVCGDSLPVRTKFITKTNKCNVHRLTFAQIYLNSSVLETIPRVENLASCMHMKAGLIVCESHALYFDVIPTYGGNCQLSIDSIEDHADFSTLKVFYVILVRHNF